MIYVSAVMPTRFARSAYIKRSIDCFLSQTFPDLELIIADDEPSPIAKLVPPNPRIHYVTTGRTTTTGDKRNAANSWATGRIIIHWDDDDWYAPERVADELGFLISTGAQVVGYHDLLYYRETDGALFKYKYHGSASYATGTSQCYWRDYWNANRFAPQQRGEDSQFSIRANNKNVLASCASRQMLVARAHADCRLNLGGHDFPRAEKLEFPSAFFDAV